MTRPPTGSLQPAVSISACRIWILRKLFELPNQNTNYENTSVILILSTLKSCFWRDIFSMFYVTGQLLYLNKSRKWKSISTPLQYSQDFLGCWNIELNVFVNFSPSTTKTKHELEKGIFYKTQLTFGKKTRKGNHWGQNHPNSKFQTVLAKLSDCKYFH